LNPEELTRRTKDFAHRCVKLALALPNNKKNCPVKKGIENVQSTINNP